MIYHPIALYFGMGVRPSVCLSDAWSVISLWYFDQVKDKTKTKKKEKTRTKTKAHTKTKAKDNDKRILPIFLSEAGSSISLWYFKIKRKTK
jgi:hypothetical protein